MARYHGPTVLPRTTGQDLSCVADAIKVCLRRRNFLNILHTVLNNKQSCFPASVMKPVFHDVLYSFCAASVTNRGSGIHACTGCRELGEGRCILRRRRRQNESDLFDSFAYGGVVHAAWLGATFLKATVEKNGASVCLPRLPAS